MATLYAKNVTANWNVASSWSATGSGGADDAGVPDATSDCVFDSGFTGSITLTASTTVNSLVCQTGAAGTLTQNASTVLTIDSADGGGDSLKFVSTMTYTPNVSADIRFTATSGTNKITSGTLTIANIIINGTGGTFQLQDNLTLNGTGATGGYTFRVQSGTFDANGKTVTFTTSGNARIGSGTTSFYKLVRTGNAVKTDGLWLYGNITVTNELSINGNSGINRVLVMSDTLGTARTLTITGATISNCSNCDFRDITFANGGANVDLSAITGGSGDCGGNTISGGGTLSFTTADDWYWNGSGTRNFSDYTYWYTATNGGGSQMASTRCPLPQDTCYFDANSIDGATTVDQDLPRMCKNLDFTGCAAMNFHMNNIAQTIYGNMEFVSNVTRTNGSTLSLEGRTGNWTLTSSSSWLDSILTFNSIGGTYLLGDNFSASYSVSVNNGTFDANDKDLTIARFDVGASSSPTILMGNGTWNISGTYSNEIFRLPSTVTITQEGSTLNLNMGNTAVTFYQTARNYTFNNISIESGTGAFTMNGSNTFSTLTISAPKTVKFTAATTTTVSSFVATGDSENLIHIDSTSSSDATLSDSSGTIQVYYCHIGETGDVDASGGASWLAYTSDGNEVNGSEGWTTAAPATGQFMSTMKGYW